MTPEDGAIVGVLIMLVGFALVVLFYPNK